MRQSLPSFDKRTSEGRHMRQLALEARVVAPVRLDIDVRYWPITDAYTVKAEIINGEGDRLAVGYYQIKGADELHQLTDLATLLIVAWEERGKDGIRAVNKNRRIVDARIKR